MSFSSVLASFIRRSDTTANTGGRSGFRGSVRGLRILTGESVDSSRHVGVAAVVVVVVAGFGCRSNILLSYVIVGS